MNQSKSLPLLHWLLLQDPSGISGLTFTPPSAPHASAPLLRFQKLSAGCLLCCPSPPPTSWAPHYGTNPTL